MMKYMSLFLPLLLGVALVLVPVLAQEDCPADVCECQSEGDDHYLFCSNRALDAIPEFQPSQLAWKVQLQQNSITEVGTDAFSNLPNAVEIELSDNQITQIHSQAFSTLSDLTLLNVGNNPTTSLPEDAFQNLVSLRSLLLQNMQLSSLPNGIFEGLVGLQYLYIHENQFTQLPSTALNEVTSLLLLDASENPIPMVDSTQQLVLPELINFYMSDCGMESFDMRLLNLLPKVTWLYIDYNDIQQIDSCPILSPDREGSIGNLPLHENPIHCGCDIYWLLEAGIELVSAVCGSPAELAGRDVNDIPAEEFRCPTEDPALFCGWNQC